MVANDSRLDTSRKYKERFYQATVMRWIRLEGRDKRHSEVTTMNRMRKEFCNAELDNLADNMRK